MCALIWCCCKQYSNYREKSKGNHIFSCVCIVLFLFLYSKCVSAFRFCSCDNEAIMSILFICSFVTAHLHHHPIIDSISISIGSKHLRHNLFFPPNKYHHHHQFFFARCVCLKTLLHVYYCDICCCCVLNHTHSNNNSNKSNGNNNKTTF